MQLGYRSHDLPDTALPAQFGTVFQRIMHPRILGRILLLLPVSLILLFQLLLIFHGLLPDAAAKDIRLFRIGIGTALLHLLRQRLIPLCIASAAFPEIPLALQTAQQIPDHFQIPYLFPGGLRSDRYPAHIAPALRDQRFFRSMDTFLLSGFSCLIQNTQTLSYRAQTIFCADALPDLCLCLRRLLLYLLPFLRMTIRRLDRMIGKPVLDGCTQHILTFLMPVRAQACHIHDLIQLRQAVDTDQVLLIVRKIHPLRKFRNTAATIKLAGLQIIKTSAVRLSVTLHCQLASVHCIQSHGMNGHAEDHTVCTTHFLRPEHPVFPFR